ncbi:MAG: hypothetical protein AAFX06_20620 [Planctomycetota bacterium]
MGQRPPHQMCTRSAKHPWVIRAWQTLLSGLAVWLIQGTPVQADLFDPLDAYPPRWSLSESDCDARVTTHENLPQGGVRGGCESITFQAKRGTYAVMLYPIEPVRALDDLVANVNVMSAKAGARVAVRVRFPYLRDTRSRRPVSVLIYGAAYDRPGRFQSIGVGSIERALRIKIANLRGSHGSDANLEDPYVDAIAINAYSGPGNTNVRIDDVTMQGMVPVGDAGQVDTLPRVADSGPTTPPTGGRNRRAFRVEAGSDLPDPAFPFDSVIRILEHQGEPLSWVRSLGFDAVLLSQPPTDDILREAIRARLLIYAPPPQAPDPKLRTLLDPVAGWYLGKGIALDNRRVEQTDQAVRRLRELPSLWRRPIVIAPTENWEDYATLGDGIVSDVPPRVRDLSPSESALQLARRRARIGGKADFAVTIATDPPARVTAMNRAIETRIGSPPQEFVRWQSILAQTIQTLEQAPRAIVFRSSESMVSGSTEAHLRSIALSYINRSVAMMAPWLADAEPALAYPLPNSNFRCGRLISGNAEILLISSEQTRGNEILAGDGQALDIELPPDRLNMVAWRMTGFRAERLPVERTASGCKITIVSPDVAEWVVISRDAMLGSKLDQSAAAFARQAASDRWRLSSQHVQHIRDAWQQASNAGAADEPAPVALLTAAQRTIGDSEPAYRAGDVDTTLRLARRADAWALRASWKLSDALMSRESSVGIPKVTSAPPLAAGHPVLQVAWHPLMGEEGWSKNLLTSGGLDQEESVRGGWNFGVRRMNRAVCDMQWIERGHFDGQGAVKLSSASTIEAPLDGGYEGTVLAFSAPPVQIQAGQAVRIDAMIRTIGFGGPHQGVLVHDSIGGQAMGRLIRGATDWTHVRLLRQSKDETDIQVLFEVLGDGEAIVDEVTVKVWDPQPLPRLPFRARVSSNRDIQ